MDFKLILRLSSNQLTILVYPNSTDQGIMFRKMGEADITLIEDDVIVHNSI